MAPHGDREVEALPTISRPWSWLSGVDDGKPEVWLDAQAGGHAGFFVAESMDSQVLATI